MYVRYSNPGLGATPVCNTAGGYKFVKPSCWMQASAACMTDADLAAAEKACSAPAVGGSSGSSAGSGTSNGSGGGSAAGSGASGGSAAATSIVDQAVAWVEANPWLAGFFVVAVVLVAVER